MTWKLLILFFTLTSCAKFGYLTEQGIGQAKIQWHAKPNEEVLKDSTLSEENKRKIRLVGEYKKFFYEYFGEKETPIYSKTTILESEAVTYLVVASPHTKIEAHEFEFPFMGSFPYIGFFKLESAKEFAKELEENEKLVAWIRPVYAYSTLGYLEDRILSSFFEYDDVELAELIFHELFHTVFFIKDDVDLNENLANLYGKELLQIFFKDRPELQNYLAKEEKKAKLNKRVVDLIAILQAEFAKLGGFITNKKADAMTAQFVEEVFRPGLKGYCQNLGLKEDDCDIKENWNQASFAAFLTYEEEQDFLEKHMREKNLGLKEYLSWLKLEYKTYQGLDSEQTFTDHLKLKVTHAPLVAD